MKLFGLHKSIYQAARLNGHVPSEKVLFRQKQVKLFVELLGRGMHSREAAQLLGHGRATLFRWKNALETGGATALEPKSTKPVHVRKPKWSPELIKKIVGLRREYPAWGKDNTKIL